MAAVWFSHQIRVRYQETDQMGVVYHANFLNWLELGRNELLRELGFSFAALESRELRMVLCRLEAKFCKPAKYDDLIVVQTRVAACDERGLEFEARICRMDEVGGARPSFEQGDLLLRARSHHAWTNRSRIPVALETMAPGLSALLMGVMEEPE